LGRDGIIGVLLLFSFFGKWEKTWEAGTHGEAGVF